MRHFQCHQAAGTAPGDSGESARNVNTNSSAGRDEKQFGFMTGKGTTDVIFIVRQMMEKHGYT